MKWILKVDCELEKEEKKWYKVAKNLGAKKSLNSFVNFHKYKELLSGAN